MQTTPDISWNETTTAVVSAPQGPSPDHPYYSYWLNCHYVFTYVLNPVAAFGILGNLLTFYVLYRRRAKTPPIVIMVSDLKVWFPALCSVWFK